MTSFIETAISIDNGPEVPGSVTIEQQTETIWSDIATKPDQRWEHVDSHGHFHAFDEKGELPTLKTRPRHVDCDGSCGGVCGGEGYDTFDYLCRICDELVEPGRVPDREPKVIPTGRSWTVQAAQRVEAGTEVSVRVMIGDKVMFGVAIGSSVEAVSDDRGARWQSQLYGNGPLGVRREPGA